MKIKTDFRSSTDMSNICQAKRCTKKLFVLKCSTKYYGSLTASFKISPKGLLIFPGIFRESVDKFARVHRICWCFPKVKSRDSARYGWYFLKTLLRSSSINSSTFQRFMLLGDDFKVSAHPRRRPVRPSPAAPSASSPPSASLRLRLPARQPSASSPSSSTSSPCPSPSAPKTPRQ